MICLVRIGNGAVVIIFLLLLLMPFLGSAQFSKAVIKGWVFDAITNKPLQGVSVGKKENEKYTVSGPDGFFILELDKGEHTVQVFLPGFQKKIIEKVKLKPGQFISLLVYLRPFGNNAVTGKKPAAIQDSVSRADSVSAVLYNKYIGIACGSAILGSFLSDRTVSAPELSPRFYKDGISVMAGRRNINLVEETPYASSFNFLISGMGARYNNLLVNGSPYTSITPMGKAFNVDIFPVEIFSDLLVKPIARASVPGEFGGGSVMATLKGLPDRNFFTLQVGTEFFHNKNGSAFYGDQREFTEQFSLPFFKKNLPAGFPGARSDTRLADKNPQEKVSLLQTLPNNLSPVNLGKSARANWVNIGWGKKYVLKGKQVIGFTAYLNHQYTEQNYVSEFSSALNSNNNPYPFSNPQTRVVHSLSDNTNFTSNSRLTGFISGAIVWNKSKITVTGLYAGQNISTNHQRNFIFKPDEDSLSFKGIRSTIEQRYTSSVFVNGEHAMGQKGRFRFDWRVNYVNYKQNNPDDRSFLLRQDSVRSDFYKIASQQTLPLPDRSVVSRSVLADNLNRILSNSGRSWKNMNDHLFSASANLSMPINIFKRAQVLSGGLYMQSHYRQLYSDILLYRGGSFNRLDGIIFPQAYFPGGVEVDEYFNPLIGAVGSFNANDVMADNYGNYLGSQNIGAAYFNHEIRLTKNVSLDWGLRLESTSQLISLFEFHFFEGFKNAEKVTLDENVNVSFFDLLPSAKLSYKPISSLEIAGAFFRTLNRPLIQELTDYRYYEPENFTVYRGNRLLTITSIDNFRGELNWKPGLFSYVSAAGFYKKIYKPIESVISNYAGSIGTLQSTPHNMPEAVLYGVEFAFKLPLGYNVNHWLHHVNVYGNATFTESTVKAGPLKSLETPTIPEHKLSGTPNYAINSGIEVSIPKYPALAVQYNRTGDYISAVGSGNTIVLANGNSIQQTPGYYIKGRTQFDIQLSQQLFRNKFEIIAGIKNILEEPYISYQDLNGNKKFDNPLTVSKEKATAGRYLSGTDNIAYRFAGIRSFYVRLSYSLQ